MDPNRKVRTNKAVFCVGSEGKTARTAGPFFVWEAKEKRPEQQGRFLARSGGIKRPKWPAIKF